jgi:hypothetical protein
MVGRDASRRNEKAPYRVEPVERRDIVHHSLDKEMSAHG